MQAIDPATGEVSTEYPDHDGAEVEARLARAVLAFAEWRRSSFAERASAMRQAAHLLRERQGALAELAAREMGKPVTQGRAEAVKCAWACDHFAEHAERLLADEVVVTEARKSVIVRVPLGPILAIMPWNYPFWQVFRFAAPALMAGNVALVKHAPGTPGCALAIEALCRDAGFPGGVLQTLLITEDHAGAVIDDLRIAGVTLTGSTRAGRAVGARASRALKKVVLELGGNDPYVVLADADVELAATTAVASRLANAGQACIAAKRLVVVSSLLPAFESRIVGRVEKAVVGSPLVEATDIGPLARVDLRDALHRQVRISLERGARLVTGGVVPPGPGAWYPPTILGDVRPGMPAFDEELFGPVLSVVPAKDDSDAIFLANRTEYGLGAVVFTRDLARGERIARDELHAGSCFVNSLVRSDPRLPFGGIKASGHGRELGGSGIREFVNEKTVWVA